MTEQVTPNWFQTEAPTVAGYSSFAKTDMSSFASHGGAYFVAKLSGPYGVISNRRLDIPRFNATAPGNAARDVGCG